jgi:hypothetical protein
MINLTSERDLIQSLIKRSLGESYIRFIVHTGKDSDTILEFDTDDRSFTLSKIDGFKDDIYGLKVWDDGKVYLIPAFNKLDIMKSNLLRIIDYFSSRLDDFYTIKAHEGSEETTITWTKKD